MMTRKEKRKKTKKKKKKKREKKSKKTKNEEMPHATIRHDQPPNNAAAPRDQRAAGATKGKKVPRTAREASSIRAAVRNA